MKLPESIADFTPGLLSEALGGIGVAGVIAEPLGEGTGMMAEISRLTLKYDSDSGLPGCMIAKYTCSNPTNREIAISYNLYERESRYFAELDRFADIVTPQIYHSSTDGQGMLILMEDLSDYAVGRQVVGATLEQTELAIDELAKLHGAFWNRIEDLDWVPGIASSYHADNMLNLANLGWDNMILLFGEHVPDAVRSQRDAYLAAIPQIQAEQCDVPRTFLHGDFRMENLLYGTGPSHHPLVVIDWQGPLTGRGVVDVALFLGQSTSTAVRQNHERELLGRYVSGLAEAGVRDYDPETAFAHYRSAILYNWVYTAVVAGTLDASNEVAFAWMSEMVARQSAASLDLEVFELLP